MRLRVKRKLDQEADGFALYPGVLAPVRVYEPGSHGPNLSIGKTPD